MMVKEIKTKKYYYREGKLKYFEILDKNKNVDPRSSLIIFQIAQLSLEIMLKISVQINRVDQG